MTTYLHQIIAVRPGVESAAQTALDQAKTVLAVGGDRSPLTGLIRTHVAKSQEFDEQPEQRRRVQLTTAGLLDHVAGAQGALIDWQLTRETGNAAARANVVVDGDIVLADAPAGFLLFLEARLDLLSKQLVAALQALDPAEDWHDGAADPALERGVYRATPRSQLSTLKKLVAHVGVDPTEFQPAQIQWRDEDVVSGTLTYTKFSGQLPAARIEEIHARLTKLVTAVRTAREEANRLEVQPVNGAGRNLLGYVFGDLLT